MTDRDINGDAVRSSYARARKLADSLGISNEAMETIAEGVREFDEQRTPEQRTVAALERLARNTAPERGDSGSREWEERRLRRREVYAQELMAVAVILDDDALAEVRQAPAFLRLVARLKGESGTAVGPVGGSAAPQ